MESNEIYDFICSALGIDLGVVLPEDLLSLGDDCGPYDPSEAARELSGFIEAHYGDERPLLSDLLRNPVGRRLVARVMQAWVSERAARRVKDFMSIDESDDAANLREDPPIWSVVSQHGCAPIIEDVLFIPSIDDDTSTALFKTQVYLHPK